MVIAIACAAHRDDAAIPACAAGEYSTCWPTLTGGGCICGRQIARAFSQIVEHKSQLAENGLEKGQLKIRLGMCIGSVIAGVVSAYRLRGTAPCFPQGWTFLRNTGLPVIDIVGIVMNILSSLATSPLLTKLHNKWMQ